LVGKIDPEIAIYSFEPDPTNRRILTETLKTNDIEASVRSEVVTDETDEVTFYERTKHASQGNSTSPTAGASSTTKESVALSDFFEREEIQAPFVKIDAEGEEYEILRDLSASANLSSISGIVEIHPDKMDATEKEIVKLFEEAEWPWKELGNTAKPGYTARPAYFFTTG
jgi:FkbM family methyltransferase